MNLKPSGEVAEWVCTLATKLGSKQEVGAIVEQKRSDLSKANEAAIIMCVQSPSVEHFNLLKKMNVSKAEREGVIDQLGYSIISEFVCLIGAKP